MSWKLSYRIVLVMALLAVLAGCTVQAPAAQPPAAGEATTAPAAEGGKVMGKFFWVQSSAWHPVHQYTQQSFLEGCKELGLDSELATTDENTLDALVALAEQTVSRPMPRVSPCGSGACRSPSPSSRRPRPTASPSPSALPRSRGLLRRQCRPIAADTALYPDPVAKAMCES